MIFHLKAQVLTAASRIQKFRFYHQYMKTTVGFQKIPFIRDISDNVYGNDEINIERIFENSNIN